jgi:sulfite exporter TauE/SafE
MLPLSLIGGALIAALLGAPHCIGMCGGFAATCSRTPRGSLAWSAGRLTTYASLGAVAGALGHLLPGPGWIASAVALALLAWFSLSLAGVLPQRALGGSRLIAAGRTLATAESLGGRFAFGVVTGLLPCGMVYAALGLAVAAASPLGGAVTMLAFGVGTLPALVLFAAALRRFAFASIWRRRLVAAAVFAAGLWSLGLRSGWVERPTRGMSHTEHRR